MKEEEGEEEGLERSGKDKGEGKRRREERKKEKIRKREDRRLEDEPETLQELCQHQSLAALYTPIQDVHAVSTHAQNGT